MPNELALTIAIDLILWWTAIIPVVWGLWSVKRWIFD